MKRAEPHTVAAVRSLLSHCCFAEHPHLPTCSHSAQNIQKRTSNHKKCLESSCPVPSSHTVIPKLFSKTGLATNNGEGQAGRRPDVLEIFLPYKSTLEKLSFIYSEDSKDNLHSHLFLVILQMFSAGNLHGFRYDCISSYPLLI